VAHALRFRAVGYIARELTAPLCSAEQPAPQGHQSSDGISSWVISMVPISAHRQPVQLGWRTCSICRQI
jgi:hypothetical protein